MGSRRITKRALEVGINANVQWVILSLALAARQNLVHRTE